MLYCVIVENNKGKAKAEHIHFDNKPSTDDVIDYLKEFKGYDSIKNVTFFKVKV